MHFTFITINAMLSNVMILGNIGAIDGVDLLCVEYDDLVMLTVN